LEQLHQGCAGDLSAEFLNFGPGDFLFKIPFKNFFKIISFLLWHQDPVFELQFV